METSLETELGGLTQNAREAAQERAEKIAQLTSIQIEYMHNIFRRELKKRGMRPPTRTRFKSLLALLGLPPDISDSQKTVEYILSVYFDLLESIAQSSNQRPVTMLPDVNRLAAIQT
jgi:hypothetical protein